MSHTVKHSLPSKPMVYKPLASGLLATAFSKGESSHPGFQGAKLPKKAEPVNLPSDNESDDGENALPKITKNCLILRSQMFDAFAWLSRINPRQPKNDYVESQVIHEYMNCLALALPENLREDSLEIKHITHICDGSHWNFCAIDHLNRKIELYDSLGGGLKDKCRIFLKHYSQELGADWHIEVVDCESQLDLESCGLYSMQNMYYWISGQHAPYGTEPEFLRFTFANDLLNAATAEEETLMMEYLVEYYREHHKTIQKAADVDFACKVNTQFEVPASW